MLSDDDVYADADDDVDVDGGDDGNFDHDSLKILSTMYSETM